MALRPRKQLDFRCTKTAITYSFVWLAKMHILPTLIALHSSCRFSFCDPAKAKLSYSRTMSPKSDSFQDTKNYNTYIPEKFAFLQIPTQC